MTKLLALILLAILLASFFALNREPREQEVIATEPATTTTTVLSDAAVPSLGPRFGELVVAMKPKPAPRARTAPKARTAPTRAASVAGGHTCGGDLPPCYVMLRESGGNPRAVNPTGCNGHGCYGKWQFSGEWRCHFGLSCDIASWTEDEQDQAARILWDSGRGCRNWAAC